MEGTKRAERVTRGGAGAEGEGKEEEGEGESGGREEKGSARLAWH